MHESVAKMYANGFLNSPESIEFKENDGDLACALGKYMGSNCTSFELPNPLPIMDNVKEIISNEKSA